MRVTKASRRLRTARRPEVIHMKQPNAIKKTASTPTAAQFVWRSSLPVPLDPHHAQPSNIEPAAEVNNVVLASESDQGTVAPVGLTSTRPRRSLAIPAAAWLRC